MIMRSDLKMHSLIFFQEFLGVFTSSTLSLSLSLAMHTRGDKRRAKGQRKHTQASEVLLLSAPSLILPPGRKVCSREDFHRDKHRKIQLGLAVIVGKEVMKSLFRDSPHQHRKKRGKRRRDFPTRRQCRSYLHYSSLESDFFPSTIVYASTCSKQHKRHTKRMRKEEGKRWRRGKKPINFVL